MGQISRSVRLFKKAEVALIAAIELYNKPDFRYREETFAILALNGWELLLKAKLLAENGNQQRCLYSYEKRQTRRGQPSKKLYLRKNRSGNIHTISLGQVIARLENDTTVRLSDAVKKNLDALTEIRDNAVHYINPSPQLAKRVLEIGTASVKNFIELAKRWFHEDFSSYHLYLMPIGFVTAPGAATAIIASPDEERVVSYLRSLVSESGSQSGADFHVSLEVNLSFKRSAVDAATKVAVTNDPSATKVELSEEDIRRLYPWDYRELTRRLRNRYIDFKQNEKYHTVRRPVMQDQRFVKSRYLDPGNPRSARKDFYNPNAMNEFDKHYTRKGGKSPA